MAALHLLTLTPATQQWPVICIVEGNILKGVVKQVQHATSCQKVIVFLVVIIIKTIICYNQHFIVQHIALEYIICFVAFHYVGLEKNELCNEQNIIDKENECTLAAISIGKYNNGITKTESSSAYPRGCYVHLTSDVWFNRHPSGNGNENAAPICRIGKFICLLIRCNR